MMSAAQAERRHSNRLPINVRVEWSENESEWRMQGVAKDISLGGIYIETDVPAVLGSRVLLGFWKGGEREPLLLRATVRWMCRGGMGVQFWPLRPIGPR